jgi:uncharacterized protein YodC (DUF2158 family)
LRDVQLVWFYVKQGGPRMLLSKVKGRLLKRR